MLSILCMTLLAEGSSRCLLHSAWGVGTRFARKRPSIFDKKAAPLRLSALLLVIL